MTLNPSLKSLLLLASLALTVLTVGPARAQYGGFSYPDYSSPGYWRRRETGQKLAKARSHHKTHRTTASHRRHVKARRVHKAVRRKTVRRSR